MWQMLRAVKGCWIKQVTFLQTFVSNKSHPIFSASLSLDWCVCRKGREMDTNIEWVCFGNAVECFSSWKSLQHRGVRGRKKLKMDKFYLLGPWIHFLKDHLFSTNWSRSILDELIVEKPWKKLCRIRCPWTNAVFKGKYC